MNEKQRLKLVVAYDSYRNEYSIAAHNQTPEEAEEFLKLWNPHLRPGPLADRTRSDEAARDRRNR